MGKWSPWLPDTTILWGIESPTPPLCCLQSFAITHSCNLSWSSKAAIKKWIACDGDKISIILFRVLFLRSSAFSKPFFLRNQSYLNFFPPQLPYPWCSVPVPPPAWLHSPDDSVPTWSDQQLSLASWPSFQLFSSISWWRAYATRRSDWIDSATNLPNHAWSGSLWSNHPPWFRAAAQILSRELELPWWVSSHQSKLKHSWENYSMVGIALAGRFCERIWTCLCDTPHRVAP